MFVIRRANGDLLAKPRFPGDRVYWLGIFEPGIAWEFDTRHAAERARDVNAHGAEVLEATRCPPAVSAIAQRRFLTMSDTLGDAIPNLRAVPQPQPQPQPPPQWAVEALAALGHPADCTCEADATPYCLHCGPRSACDCGPIDEHN